MQDSQKLRHFQNMNRNLRQTLSWCDLPPELLSTIANRVKSSSNDDSCLVTFRGVCKSWRSSVLPPFLKLHSSRPYKVTFNNDCGIFRETGFFVVSTAVYLLRKPDDSSAKPWLVAVEQSSSGKLHLFHPLTRAPIENLPQNFPKVLSKDFSAVKLSQGWNIRLADGTTSAFKQQTNNKYSVSKVVLWPNNNPNYAVVLYSIGHVVCFRLLKKTQSECSRISGLGIIDDIILWKHMVWAVNRRGRLFGIDCREGKVNVTGPSCNLSGCRRNRLVSNSKNLLLYLIVVTDNLSGDQFSVYYLCSLYTWVKYIGFSSNTLLFVTSDTCFITSPQNFPEIEGKCIIFAKHCFPRYKGGLNSSDDKLFSNEANEYLQVGVSVYEKDKDFKLISALPEFSSVFWPPPEWIWNTHEYKNLSLKDQKQEMAYACNAGIDVVPPSQTEFQGMVVSSELVPILQKVWAKYGNIDEEFVPSRRCKSKAMAFESLGKVINILQTVTVNNLTGDQAQYLVSTLGDLQYMGLELGWLVPFVEKAFVLHKSKPLAVALMELEKAFVLHKSTPLAEALSELEKAKAHAEEMVNNRKLNRRLGSLFDNMLVSELMDLDKYLGEGII